MGVRRPVALALALVGLLLALGGCGGSGGVEYAVEELDSGAPVGLDDLRGEPALLVSWATWCRECDEVLAGVQAFASSPAAEGVRVVAVNLDAADVEDEIQSKIDRHGLTVELWRDRGNEFRRAFGALGVPTAVVVDGAGEVEGTFPGAADLDGAEVQAALEAAAS
jgi:peroxiredoxin